MSSGKNSEEGKNNEGKYARFWPTVIQEISARAAYYRAKAEQIQNPKPLPEGCWTKGSAISTFLAAVLACVAAVIFGAQLIVSLNDQSAFVWVKNIAFIPSRNPDKMFLSVEWQNSGRTPTVGLHTQINFLASESSEWRDYFANCNFKTSHPLIALGAQTSETLALTQVPSATVIGLTKNTSSAAHVWGVTAYSDQRGRPHESRFCWNIESADGQGSAYVTTHTLCGTGNCTDDECQKADKANPPLGTCEIEVRGKDIVIREPKPK